MKWSLNSLSFRWRGEIWPSGKSRRGFARGLCGLLGHRQWRTFGTGRRLHWRRSCRIGRIIWFRDSWTRRSGIWSFSGNPSPSAAPLVGYRLHPPTSPDPPAPVSFISLALPPATSPARWLRNPSAHHPPPANSARLHSLLDRRWTGRHLLLIYFSFS